jgi:nucleoside-diphosphate-sugar epimerase
MILINKFIKNKKPDLIIHTAAAKGANKSNIDPKTFIDINAFGTLNICESMRINKIKKLVYISSCSFYKRKKTEIFEDDPIDNNTPYGFGKYIGEKIVNYYSNKYSLNSVAFRPNLITGNRLKDDNLFYSIIEEVLKKGTATVFGNGKHIREFIHPFDIYTAIKLWIKKKNKMKFEYYNITNNRYIILDAIKRILFFLKKGKIILKKKNSRSFSVKLNCHKIKKELKWSPKLDLDYIIKDNYEAFK